jgi:transcriptional regulator GlxA family with amidase domain
MPKMTPLNRDCLQPDSPDPGAGSRPQLSVGLVLLDQFTLAAFSGFVDVLRLSADLGGGSRQIHTAWRVMSVDGLPRTSSAGITLEVSGGLAQDLEAFDYVAICGGNDYLNTHLPNH